MRNLKRPTSQKKKGEAYLFGPFVGEISWEFYRFAPHAIYLKKMDPSAKIIVLTRKERFDLYGKYASVLVPLNIKDEKKYKQSEFGLIDYKIEYYNTIKKYFFEKYNKDYVILGHFCPNVHSWQRKIKWQLPRRQMDYDFFVRNGNDELVESIIGNYLNMTFVENRYADSMPEKYINITSDDCLARIVEKIDNTKTTYYGCLISLLKHVDFIVGNLKSPISHLAILLGVPLISVNEKLSDDQINLLNPLNTRIIRCSTVKEGVLEYENNLRSKEGWPWKQWRFLYSSEIREHFS